MCSSYQKDSGTDLQGNVYVLDFQKKLKNFYFFLKKDFTFAKLCVIIQMTI